MKFFGLEWHRWLFFFMAWLPWLIVTVWYYRQMKDAFRRNPDPFGRGSDSTQ